MNKQKLRYAMLKEVEKGKEEVSAEDFEISHDDFAEQAMFLKREGYITSYCKADNMIWLVKGVTRITQAGENYIQENSTIGKSYKVAKEIRDWIK